MLAEPPPDGPAQAALAPAPGGTNGHCEMLGCRKGSLWPPLPGSPAAPRAAPHRAVSQHQTKPGRSSWCQRSRRKQQCHPTGNKNSFGFDMSHTGNVSVTKPHHSSQWFYSLLHRGSNSALQNSPMALLSVRAGPICWRANPKRIDQDTSTQG